MPVRVRIAPSPTGLLHIGTARTALFNWLFARHEGGEFRLRIENTDTSREVAEAVDQIQDSLRWLGLDWDGPHSFQLDRMDDCRRVAEQLVADEKAYEDEGAIRFRMPDDGVTAWKDVVRGRIEYPNEKLEDVVIVRSDGRPTYNFASPMEDVWDGITHVIRGDDHIPNTPKQLNIIRAVGAEVPVYAHVPMIFGMDGKKLSKRHGAQAVEEFRTAGYLPETMLNFLALLGWAPDGETTLMSREELIERFSLERVSPSPSQFDYQKLDWMNGVYLRELEEEEFVHRLLLWLGENGYDWDAELVAHAAPLVQEKIAKLSEFPAYAGFLFHDVEPDPAQLEDGGPMLAGTIEALGSLPSFDAGAIEAALRATADGLGLKPRQAFQPVRVAVTGSRISPGLFESIALLGRDTTLSRLRAAAALPTRVLVVDDEPSVRLVCRVNLELDGFEVLEAGSLTQAREALAGQPVDVVVLDLRLGNERGDELVAECHRRRPRVPVVVLTGSADTVQVAMADPDAVLSKPFEVDELVATVHGLARTSAPE
jgi:glutamyl/glutaminyl-tRNA synthetase